MSWNQAISRLSADYKGSWVFSIHFRRSEEIIEYKFMENITRTHNTSIEASTIGLLPLVVI